MFNYSTRQHSSRMRTDRAVTTSSSERVSSRPAVDRQTPVKTLPSLAFGNKCKYMLQLLFIFYLQLNKPSQTVTNPHMVDGPWLLIWLQHLAALFCRPHNIKHCLSLQKSKQRNRITLNTDRTNIHALASLKARSHGAIYLFATAIF